MRLPTAAHTPIDNRQTIGHYLDNSRLLFWCSLGILLLSLSILGLAMHSEHADRQHMQRAAEVQAALRPGQSISLGSATMSISDVKYSAGTSHFAAPAGKQYLVLSLHVKNYGDHPISVLPSTDTYVKDTSGHIIYLTPYEVADPFRAGELLPGEQIQGQLSYLIPDDGSIKFYIDAIWSGGVVPIALK